MIINFLTDIFAILLLFISGIVNIIMILFALTISVIVLCSKYWYISIPIFCIYLFIKFKKIYK